MTPVVCDCQATSVSPALLQPRLRLLLPLLLLQHNDDALQSREEEMLHSHRHESHEGVEQQCSGDLSLSLFSCDKGTREAGGSGGRRVRQTISRQGAAAGVKPDNSRQGIVREDRERILRRNMGCASGEWDRKREKERKRKECPSLLWVSRVESTEKIICRMLLRHKSGRSFLPFFSLSSFLLRRSSRVPNPRPTQLLFLLPSLKQA